MYPNEFEQDSFNYDDDLAPYDRWGTDSVWVQPYPILPGVGKSRHFSPSIFNIVPSFTKNKPIYFRYSFPAVGQVSLNSQPSITLGHNSARDLEVNRNGDALSGYVNVGQSSWGNLYYLDPAANYSRKMWQDKVLAAGGDHKVNVSIVSDNYGGERNTMLADYTTPHTEPFFNVLALTPDVVASGEVIKFAISGNFLDENFKWSDFKEDARGYINFIDKNGDSITQWKNSNDQTLLSNDKITVLSQRLRRSFDDNVATQLFEITAQIGSAVKAGLYSVDLNLGPVHAYPDELSKQYAGKNGAHRMKEALMIVGVDLQEQDRGEDGRAGLAKGRGQGRGTRGEVEV